MQPLLHKEYLVNRQTLFLSVLILAASSLIIADTDQISLMLPVIYSCLYPMMSEKNEDTNKSEVLINSLPVSRKRIVLSKYVFSLLTALVYLGFTFLLNVLIPQYTANPPEELIFGLAAVALYLAVYFPVQYLLGPRFIMIGMLLLILVIPGVVYPVLNLGARNGFWGFAGFVRQFSLLQVGIAAFLFSLLILSASYLLSCKIYERKEF